MDYELNLVKNYKYFTGFSLNDSRVLRLDELEIFTVFQSLILLLQTLKRKNKPQRYALKIKSINSLTLKLYGCI